MTKKKNSLVAKDAFDWNLLKRLFALATPYRGTFTLAAFLTILMAFIGPLRPFLIQYTLDEFVAKGNLYGLYMMSAIILALIVISSGIQLWSTFLTNFLGQTIIRDLRAKVYKHVVSFRLKYFDRTPVGTVVTRNVNDIETINEIFSQGLINITGDVLQIVFILMMMFYSDWRLSLVSLSILPLLLYSGYIFKIKVKSSFEDVRNQVARLNTFVQEHIVGMQVVQIFNREKREMEKFRQINEAHRTANINAIFYYSVFFPVVEVIAAISVGLMVWYGSRGVMLEQTTIGTMIAFIMYNGMFFRPIRQLADRLNTLQMGMVASERIFKLLDEKKHLEIDNSILKNKINGEIEFKDVWFGYNEDEPILKGISFKVEKGKTLALVGATGAGKSSIINILSRFYEISSGKILIDGIDIREFELNDLRKQISVVMQDVFLFSGSVNENVKLNDNSITDEKVIEVSKKLGAHRFVNSLPLKYNQEVNERGSSLSSGQKQLISFVRAMLPNPAILVLDEATSSIDHETEEIIQEAISKMMEHRTSIVVAHRLSTIQYADEILVIDKGLIIERGNHNELLEKNGTYKSLYDHQFNMASF